MGGRQRGGTGQGMMGGARVDGQYGPMHEYMEKAFAEALGISQTDLETALAGGKTMWQVAQEKGMTLDQFQKVMLDARTNAFKQMVADGVITQAQADWMLSRMGARAVRMVASVGRVAAPVWVADSTVAMVPAGTPLHLRPLRPPPLRTAPSSRIG